MIVKTHPLAEVVAKKLSGITGVPPSEQSRMANRAAKAAVEWYESNQPSSEQHSFDYNNTSFTHYQRESAKTDLTPGNKRQHALELVGEVGELAQLIKREYRDGTEPDKDVVEAELGDVLWGLTQIATDYEIDMFYVALGNLAKLHSRQARGVLNGSGDNR